MTSSGYGVHSRQIFEAIESIQGITLEVECLNWGNTPWILNGETNNGLIISEQALKLRGAGEILGTRQSGGQMFKILDINKHENLPEDLQADLRPYQQVGVNWLSFLRQAQLGGILFAERQKVYT